MPLKVPLSLNTFNVHCSEINIIQINTFSICCVMFTIRKITKCITHG